MPASDADETAHRQQLYTYMDTTLATRSSVTLANIRNYNVQRHSERHQCSLFVITKFWERLASTTVAKGGHVKHSAQASFDMTETYHF